MLCVCVSACLCACIHIFFCLKQFNCWRRFCSKEGWTVGCVLEYGMFLLFSVCVHPVIVLCWLDASTCFHILSPYWNKGPSHFFFPSFREKTKKLYLLCIWQSFYLFNISPKAWKYDLCQCFDTLMIQPPHKLTILKIKQLTLRK